MVFTLYSLFSTHNELSEFAPRDIYNCDETGLYWRGLPDRGFVPANVNPTGVLRTFDSGEANSASYYRSIKINVVKTVVTILYNNSNTHSDCSTDLSIQ